MGERVMPVGDNDTEQPLPSTPPSPPPPPPLPLALPLPPGRSETYIIQIQRDQIYRVPPPEHALIVESHRKGIPDSKKKHYSLCAIILACLVVIAIGIGVVTFVVVSYNPKSPEFSVSQIHGNNLQSSPARGHADHHPGNPEFPISILFRNTNKKMEVRYGEGTMTLMFKGQKFAKGKSPLLNQEAGDESTVKQTLNGTKGGIPVTLQKSLIDKNPKSITLMIDMPLEVTSWVKNLKTELHVTCYLKVHALGKDTKILSQNCRTNF